MFGLTTQDLELILAVLRRYPEIDEAVVFGSRAMGNHKPGSDVDIALKGTLKSETIGNVFAALNEQIPLPYKFDVVDYSSITHEPLIEHIDRYGKTLYKK